MNSERITETELRQIRKIPKSPLHHIIVPWFTELWDIIVPWFTELWDILPPDLQICIRPRPRLVSAFVGIQLVNEYKVFIVSMDEGKI